MKHLITILIMTMLTLGVNAQSGTTKTLVDSDGVSTDTLTNALTADLYVNSTFSGKNLLSIQVKADNISGTTAGTAILQESINGSDYVTHATADSLTVSDGAGYIWHVTDTPSVKYRIRFMGSGTQSSVVTGNYVYK